MTDADTNLNPPPAWQAFGRNAWCALIITMIIALALVLPRVVWSVCLDDPGELQVAAAVGGIGHPPGHAGIVSLYRIFCVALPIPPHLTVSGLNTIFSLSVVAILATLLLRLGANPVATVVASLLFLVDNEFWHLALVPEVYGACMMLLAGSVYLFWSWLHDRRAWKFFAAATLYAFLVANRAPTLGLTAAFAIILILDVDARRRFKRRPLRISLSLVAIGLSAVLIVILGVWFRDVPGNAYNYMDLANAGNLDYPASNANFHDKWQRLWWLLSARQFDYMFHPTPVTVRAQGIWLLSELGYRKYAYIDNTITLVTAAVVLLGTASLLRRNKPVAMFVLLMLPAGFVPILLIRAISYTAFLPSLLFPLMLLFGLGLSRTMAWRPSAAWKATPILLVAITVWWSADASLLARKESYSAEKFIAEVDLPSLPPDAILLTTFDALALKYTQKVLGVRPDITLLHVTGRLTREFLENTIQPVYTTAATLPPNLNARLTGDGRAKRILLN